MKFKVLLLVLVVSLSFNALTCASLIGIEIYLDFFVDDAPISETQRIEYPVHILPPEKTESDYKIIILPTPAPNEIISVNGMLVW